MTDPNEDAGSSTHQYVTGSEETADFTTDAEPTGETPSDGSSNAGLNDRDGNAPGATPEPPD